MKAAVVVDDWKLPVFREVLKAGGFRWEEVPFGKVDPMRGCTVMQVICDSEAQIKPFVEKAYAQAIVEKHKLKK